MWIEREWTSSIASLARGFPAVLVTGPRQVGKTALLRRQFPKASYLTFDDPATARHAESHPADFFDNLSEPAILDEIQYVPSLFRVLKQRIDRDRRPGRFLLTGSQTFELMQNVSESLAGRCGIIEMSTLSWSEIREARAQAEPLTFLVEGGFPALHAGQATEARDFYSSYVATYLERDVRNLKAVGSLRDFDRFLRACAVRTGQLLSYSDLARDVGVAPNTAKGWISVLEASGQIRLIEPYHRSLGKRLVKSPKLCLMDTGLACRLVGIDDREALLRSPMAGALWETWVIGQVIRHFQASRDSSPLWFWRTSQGHEVDLVIERGGRFTIVECKLAENPDAKATLGLTAFATMYGEDVVDDAMVVCRPGRPYVLGQGPKSRAVGISELIKAISR